MQLRTKSERGEIKSDRHLSQSNIGTSRFKAARIGAGLLENTWSKVSIPIVVFVVALVWPLSSSFVFAGLFLPVYRIALLFLLPIAAVSLLTNRVRPALPDFFITGFSVLQAAVLIAHYGVTSQISVFGLGGASTTTVIANIGSTFVDSLGPYLLARAYIRTERDVAAAVRVLIVATLLIGVFALAESLSGVSLFGAVGRSAGARFGFYRAAGPFPHAILWGLFGASTFIFATAEAVVGGSTLRRLAIPLLLAIAVASSVSSSPIAALAIQGLLILWFRFTSDTPKRGFYFLVGCLCAYLFVDLLSNRTPIQVLFSYAALDPATGYMRTLIWQFGWADFMTSPFIGIGFQNWARPVWMGPSLDAFWLVILLHYGLLGTLPLVMGIAAALRSAVRNQKPTKVGTEPRFVFYWIASLVSLIVAGFTVHLWLQNFAEFFFLIGMWGAFAGDRRNSISRQPAMVPRRVSKEAGA